MAGSRTMNLISGAAASMAQIPGLPSFSGRSSFLPGGRDRYAVLGTGLSARNQNARILALRSPSAVGKGGHGGRFVMENGDEQEPFLLTLVKDVIWSIRFLVSFLAEQPGQLKYIEWPSIQSTLKTAMLTLVLVAALIVALSSVDSGLCYVLALVLRRSA